MQREKQTSLIWLFKIKLGFKTKQIQSTRTPITAKIILSNLVLRVKLLNNLAGRFNQKYAPCSAKHNSDKFALHDFLLQVPAWNSCKSKVLKLGSEAFKSIVE